MSDREDEQERAEVSEEEATEPDEDVQEQTEFTAADEYHEAFGSPQIQRVIDDDGMPTPVINEANEDAHAPAFLPEENQVCAAIWSEFVMRDYEWGEIIARFAPEKVTRTPNGKFRADLKDASWTHDKIRDFAPIEHDTVEVEPIRRQCEHYLLQLRPPPPSMAHILKYGELNRYCTARRSVAGAFLSLKDDAMRACSLRSPPDGKSAELLRSFDTDLAEKSKHRSFERMFREKKKPKEEEEKLEAFQAASASIFGNVPDVPPEQSAEIPVTQAFPEDEPPTKDDK